LLATPLMMFGLVVGGVLGDSGQWKQTGHQSESASASCSHFSPDPRGETKGSIARQPCEGKPGEAAASRRTPKLQRSITPSSRPLPVPRDHFRDAFLKAHARRLAEQNDLRR
jgi:hypothetical protein